MNSPQMEYEEDTCGNICTMSTCIFTGLIVIYIYLWLASYITRKMVSINYNKYINHIPNSSVLITSILAKRISYPSLRVRNDFLYWNKLLSVNKKIKAYNFDPGNPYFVYGSNPGISSNKIKLVRNQWLLYRKNFRYSYQ